MNSKRLLQTRRGQPDSGDLALVAWKIIGSLISIIIIGSIVAMLPEMARYLKLKSM